MRRDLNLIRLIPNKEENNCSGETKEKVRIKGMHCLEVKYNVTTSVTFVFMASYKTEVTFRSSLTAYPSAPYKRFVFSLI
jgi:hypothetical protein